MRPLPSKAICAGSSMSGSVSTGSSLNPGGSQKRFASSAGDNGTTGGFLVKSGSLIEGPRPRPWPRAGGAPGAAAWFEFPRRATVARVLGQTRRAW